MENSGGWKTYRKFGEKPLPKNVFGPPPTIRFPPPFFGDSLSFPLKRKRHRPDQPQFLRPPKVVLESTLCSTFPPPPPKFTRYVLPPPQPLPNTLEKLAVLPGHRPGVPGTPGRPGGFEKIYVVFYCVRERENT